MPTEGNLMRTVIIASVMSLAMLAMALAQNSAGPTIDQTVDKLTSQAITNITLMAGQIKQDATTEQQMQARINELAAEVNALKEKYEPKPGKK